MDRAPAAPADELSVVVFEEVGTPGHQLTVRRRTLRRGAWGSAALVLACVALLGVLGLTVPRALHYDALVAENLELQSRLQRIDRRMAEVDRILLRLRLYDAQLESLGDPRDDAGPLPQGVWANDEPVWPASAAESPGHDGVRPATVWAEGVEARADTFLRTFADAEPTLNRFVGELEELEALERALPSFWPARGAFSSGFGWRRNPIGRRWRFHAGIDLAGDRGDPIHAAAQGKVVAATWSGGYGRHLMVDHGFGIVTLYAHCRKLLVEEGDHVRRGQKIALMGSTGRSTGPHLHFEVHLDGTPVNPLDYLRRATGRPPARRRP